MNATTFAVGQKVRYEGPCMEPDFGAIGVFCWLVDYDLNDGSYRGQVPGFVRHFDSQAFYCDLSDLVAI